MSRSFRFFIARFWGAVRVCCYLQLKDSMLFEFIIFTFYSLSTITQGSINCIDFEMRGFFLIGETGFGVGFDFAHVISGIDLERFTKLVSSCSS